MYRANTFVVRLLLSGDIKNAGDLIYLTELCEVFFRHVLSEFARCTFRNRISILEPDRIVHGGRMRINDCLKITGLKRFSNARVGGTPCTPGNTPRVCTRWRGFPRRWNTYDNV